MVIMIPGGSEEHPALCLGEPQAAVALGALSARLLSISAGGVLAFPGLSLSLDQLLSGWWWERTQSETPEGNLFPECRQKCLGKGNCSSNLTWVSTRI